MQPGDTVKLNTTVKSMFNKGVVYGVPGDIAIIISVSKPVLIVENPYGKKFPLLLSEVDLI